jgi:hypothetical protein
MMMHDLDQDEMSNKMTRRKMTRRLRPSLSGVQGPDPRGEQQVAAAAQALEVGKEAQRVGQLRRDPEESLGGLVRCESRWQIESGIAQGTAGGDRVRRDGHEVDYGQSPLIALLAEPLAGPNSSTRRGAIPVLPSRKSSLHTNPPLALAGRLGGLLRLHTPGVQRECGGDEPGVRRLLYRQQFPWNRELRQELGTLVGQEY